LRRVANAVLLNEKNEVGLMHARKPDFYVLPGGGIEEGESVIEALKREVKEEVGADCEVTGELGVVMCYEEEAKNINVSYTFIAKLSGSVGERQLTKGEIEADCVIEWKEIDEMIEAIRLSKPQEYIGHFLKRREALILEEFKKIKKYG